MFEEDNAFVFGIMELEVLVWRDEPKIAGVGSRIVLPKSLDSITHFNIRLVMIRNSILNENVGTISFINQAVVKLRGQTEGVVGH